MSSFNKKMKHHLHLIPLLFLVFSIMIAFFPTKAFAINCSAVFYEPNTWFGIFQYDSSEINDSGFTGNEVLIFSLVNDENEEVVSTELSYSSCQDDQLATNNRSCQIQFNNSEIEALSTNDNYRLRVSFNIRNIIICGNDNFLVLPPTITSPTEELMARPCSDFVTTTQQCLFLIEGTFPGFTECIIDEDPNQTALCCQPGEEAIASPPECRPTITSPTEELNAATLNSFNPLLSNQDPESAAGLAQTLSTPAGIINRALVFAFPLAGMILFVMLLYAGFQIVAGAANKKALDEGKQRATSALIGFLLLFSAFWIVQLLEVIFNISIL